MEFHVLRPFHRSEVLSVAEAAVMAGRSERTIRDWCARFDVGRRIGGRWAVSKAALAMLLDGNKTALERYLGGDRSSPLVTDYFRRCGVPLPGRLSGIREDCVMARGPLTFRQRDLVRALRAPKLLGWRSPK
jgi:hypothetical protein